MSMYLRPPLVRAFLLGFALLTIALPQAASAKDEPKPLALRKIMKDLGRDMQEVTLAIAKEDWDLVGKIADRIAEHPQPPMGERVRILAFVSGNVSEFKANDEMTQQNARSLEKAAAVRDARSAIAAFANLQGSCHQCHQSFRKPFLEHFYGQR